MFRLSPTLRLLAQSRYVQSHKKAPVDVPTMKPTKYIYEVKYHPSSRPGVDLGFPNHEHLNPFVEQGGNRHENFRYSYTGQWWEGHFLPKVLFLLAPFFFYFWIRLETAQKTRRRVEIGKAVMVDSFPHHTGLVGKAA